MTTAVIAFAAGVLFLVALAAVSLHSAVRRRKRAQSDGGPILPIGAPDGDAGGGDA